MIRITSLFLASFALAFTGCRNLTPSEQLERMFEKTIAPSTDSGPPSTSEVARMRSDQDRRAVRVREIVENDRLTSAEDAYRAAVILYDSPRLEDVSLAQELAKRAHDDGMVDAIRIVAHCMDRSLMMRGQPQTFGTQVKFEPVLAKWRLYDLSPTTTDSERAAFRVPPLAELQARVGYLNEKR